MTVELPKDADGREIPLDVEFLYNANGESVKPYSFTFRRYDGFCWEMRLVGAPQDLVYETNSFYLTPPDSYEKLLDDLDKAASKTYCGTCTYFGKNPTDCDTCSIGDISVCDSAAMCDIADRIRKLRGEDE